MKKITEQELKAYADMKAETISIRTWENGNSYDTPRTSTAAEKNLIAGVIYGALLAILHGSDTQSAADTAEFTGNVLMKTVLFGVGSMNGYDTIYCPIRAFEF